jgi:hypothetical protein
MISTIITLLFATSGIIVLVVIVVAMYFLYGPDYEGPDTSNWPTPPGQAPLSAYKYGANITNNTTDQTTSKEEEPKNTTIPTIGEVLRKSQAGFLYSSMAAEEERPEPWALLIR